MRARVKVTGDDVHSSHDTASPCEVLSEMDAEDPDFLRRTPGPRGRGTELRAAAAGPRRELPPAAPVTHGRAERRLEAASQRLSLKSRGAVTLETSPPVLPLPMCQSRNQQRGHRPQAPEPRTQSPGSNAAPRRSEASTRGTGNSRVSTPLATCSEPPPNLPLKVTNLQCGKILTNIE